MDIQRQDTALPSVDVLLSRSTVDQMIAIWLHAKTVGPDKSAATARAYPVILRSFRGALQEAGLDLDSADPRVVSAVLQRDGKAPTTDMIADACETMLTALATIAQGWSRAGEAGKATINRRLAIVSSFYLFVLRQGLLRGESPIARMEREKVQAYATSRAIPRQDIKTRLAAIDRATMAGKRDYALLLMGLHTGRRAAELAGMRVKDVTQGDDEKGRATCFIEWPHTKGGDSMINQLPMSNPAIVALLAWLQAVDESGRSLTGDDLIWFSLADNGTRNHPLSTHALSDICMKRLGVSQVHKLRHSFAWAMEDAGAKVSDIQRLLGHKNIATTGRYLARKNEGRNEHIDDLSALYGL